MSKIVKPEQPEQNDEINLKDLLEVDFEIVTKSRKAEVDEKVLAKASEIAKVFSESNITDGVKVPITLEKLYSLFGEPSVTRKGTMRTKLNTPIYDVLVKEMHKVGLDINQFGKHSKIRVKATGKEKEAYLVEVSKLVLKDHQEVKSNGEITTKEGWVVDIAGTGLPKDVLKARPKNGDYYRLKVTAYDGANYPNGAEIFVQKGSDDEKAVKENEKMTLESNKNAEVAEAVGE